MTFLDEAFSRVEAAKKASCSTRHLDRAIERGDLIAYKPGRDVKILPRDLSRWIQSKQVKPRPRRGPRRKRITAKPRPTAVPA